MQQYLTKLALAAALLGAGPAAAQSPVLGWEWAQALGRPSGGGLIETSLQSLVATADGGAVVGGFFTGYVVLGPHAGDTLRAGSGTSGLVAKYSAAGRRQWAAAVAAPITRGDGYASLVAVNGRQQVLALTNHDTAVPLPGGVGTAPGAGVVWSRYEAASGRLQQAGELGQGSFGCSFATADTAGNFALAGGVAGLCAIGSYSMGARLTRFNWFVAKVTPTGTPLWVREFRSGSPGVSGLFGQAVLPNGDVLVSGALRDTLVVDAAHRLVGPASGYGGYVVCYDGHTGAVRWARTVPVPVYPAVDARSGQAYIGGTFSGLLAIDQAAALATVSQLFVARLDGATGTVPGMLFSSDGPHAQTVSRLVSQPGGGVAFVGSGQGGVSLGVDFALPAATPNTYISYVAQVDAQGGVQALYQTPGATLAAVDPGGRPYAALATTRQVQFGQLPVLTPRGGFEGFLAHVGLVVLGTRPAVRAAAALGAYPNPVPPAEAVAVACAWPAAQLRLHDGLGRVVWAGAAVQGQAQVPTAGLPPGLYVLRASDGAHTIACKLLVN